MPKVTTRVDEGFQRFGDEGLQHMALDRHRVDAGQLHDPSGAAGDRDRHLLGADLAARGRDAGDAVAVAQEAGDLAILDDVDAAPVGAARIAPGDRIVAGGAGAPLHQAADDREACRLPKCPAPAPARLISAGVINSASTPRWRMALPRRA